ncbi:MAG: SpaA isopeptide-forming pilin-related protein, partial [Candidatus Humimicrobiaceae bacterium]
MSIKIKNFNYCFSLKIFVFLFLIIFLLSSLFIYGCRSKQVTQKAIQIPVNKVYEIINSVQNYIISDIRAKEEFNKKHLQSATSVLLDNFVNRLKELSNDKPIIIFASAAGKPSIEVKKTGLEGNDQAKLQSYYVDDSNNKVYVNNSSQTVSNKSSKASGANLEFRTYYVEKIFDRITNTYTYNVTNPLAIIPVDSTIKVEKTIQNSPSQGSVVVTMTNLLGGDQANLFLYYANGSDRVNVLPSPQTVADGGRAIWTNLALGNTYYVEETFDGITNTYTYNVTNPLAIIPVDSTIKVEKTIQNNPKIGSITITKTGLDVSDKATLSLYNTMGTADTGDDVIVSTSPQLVSNGEKAIWSNLPFGTYYVIEDFKDIKTNVYTYEAKSPLLITLDSANKTETFANTALEGSIEITNKNLLGGDYAKLSLYYLVGSTRVNVLPSPQTVADGGKAIWTGLALGNIYYVEEGFSGITANVYSYSITNPVATIPVDSTTKVEKTVQNSPKYGSITITKKDMINGSMLAGAVFGLFKADGITPATGSNGKLVANQTSGADGKATFTIVAFGTYVVKEIVAPAGYNLATPVTVTVGQDNEDISIGILASRIPGFLRLMKVDSVTDLPIAGAEYRVYDGGVNVGTLITGPDGCIAVSKLSWYIEYIIKEHKAPAGYLLDTNSYIVTFSPTNTFNILSVKDNPTGRNTKLTVEEINEKGIIQVLAFTLVDPIIAISVSAVFIFGLVLIIVPLRRRHYR